MANPQVEDGHIRISNKVWEAIVAIRISGEARQVLDFIIRKTWGWGKKTDLIPLSQFCDATGLRKSAIIKARKKLLSMKLITVTQKVNTDILSYGFQKDYHKWKPLPKKITVTKKVNHLDPKSKFPLPKKRPSIDTGSKDTSSKDINKEDFILFYEAYPLKKNPREAEKAWDQIFNKKRSEYYCGEFTEFIMKIILKAIKDQKEEREKKALRGFSEAWPHPATWLRNHRWNDVVEELPEEPDPLGGMG